MTASLPICFDLSDWSLILITGPDRASYLHSFCSNDIKSLKPGEGCEAFITNIKGRILGHVLVFAGESQLVLLAVPGANQIIAPHLQKYLIGVEAEVADETGQHLISCLNRTAATVLLAGEQAPPLTFTGCVTPDEKWINAAQELGISSGDGCTPSELPARPGDQTPLTELPEAILACTELLPGYGWLVIGPAALKNAFVQLLDSYEVLKGSPEEFDALRIEAGFPWHGKDISEENIAQEAGRNEKTISFKKGCYLGQEPIARLDAMGHTNKELRRVVIHSETPPEIGAVITLNGVEAGKITSSRVSSKAGQCVALAMLRTNATAPDTKVVVNHSDQHFMADVR